MFNFCFIFSVLATTVYLKLKLLTEMKDEKKWKPCVNHKIPTKKTEEDITKTHISHMPKIDDNSMKQKKNNTHTNDMFRI